MSDIRDLTNKVREAVSLVKDPELPSVNIIELGMLEGLTVVGTYAHIQLLPTFSGCPALDIIEGEVKEAVLALPEISEVDVDFVYHTPWTSSRISPEGREKLKEFGVAPPPEKFGQGPPWEVACPYCGSHQVVMDNLFGPTACRSILYCHSCKNPFEAMKPVG